MSHRKILMVMPSLPYPETGAEQLDRAFGIRQLKRLGYEVRVVAKVLPERSDNWVEQAREAHGIPIRTVPYMRSGVVRKVLGRLRDFRFLDGAAYEYADPILQEVVGEEMRVFRPDILWCEYTFLWPVHHFAKEAGIPLVVRSHNFEPEHFLQEEGNTFFNLLRAMAKRMSERESTRADLLFAISPLERDIYKRLGARKVEVLPLRCLYPLLVFPRNEPSSEGPIRVVFSGSTYAVPHNLAAVRFLLERIIPRANTAFPNVFEFHISGNKLPSMLVQRMPRNAIYDGFVEDYDTYYAGMHIALAPSLFGAGMQKKVFDPLARGMAMITSRRGLSGYPFLDARQVLFAQSPEQYVSALGQLRNQALRARLGEAARTVAEGLFSQAAIDDRVSKSIAALP